jgi:cell division protease FtsH
MGATNRPDVLDPALTRAGRLDVKIRVDPTDRAGRIEVIKGYLEPIKSVEEIDIEGFASDTTGLTPADLKTILTRRAPAYALFSGRDGISNEDLRATMAEQSMGLRQPIAGMLPEDKRSIAYHEAGHAVTTWALTDDKITRVSIIRYSGGPTGGASLGHVYPVPQKERWSRRLNEVEDKICVSLSGRAAELEFLGEPHSGARSDLGSVRTRLLGLAEEGYFSSIGYKSEPTAKLIKEMDKMVERCMEKARGTLKQHADKVEALVRELLEKEELNTEEVMAVLGERPDKVTEQAQVTGAA